MILEHEHQTALFTWAKLAQDKYPQLEWMHANPNGEHRLPTVAMRLKAEGVKAGIPDIFLPWPANGRHGLYIELKRQDRRTHKNGGLSAEQVKTITALRNLGYDVFVCYCWWEAAGVIEKYCGGTDNGKDEYIRALRRA